MTKQPSAAWQRYLATLPPELASLHDEPPEEVLTTSEGHVVTVQDLLAVLRDQTTEPHGSGDLALREDQSGPGLLAAAWRTTTYRQASAVLALFDAGLAVEAQANARVCLEHAVALQRLALAVDDGELDPLLLELMHQQQRRQQKHLEYLDDLDARTGGQHQGLLNATRSQHDSQQVPAAKSRPDAHTVFALFLRVPNGIHLYNVFARLSENTHAGLSGAAPYLLRALRHDEPVPASPEPVQWAEALALLCWSCWAADDAMRRFLVDGDDISDRHISIMARVGLAAG